MQGFRQVACLMLAVVLAMIVSVPYCAPALRVDTGFALSSASIPSNACDDAGCCSGCLSCHGSQSYACPASSRSVKDGTLSGCRSSILCPSHLCLPKNLHGSPDFSSIVSAAFARL
jgi:hypothetical protein